MLEDLHGQEVTGGHHGALERQSETKGPSKMPTCSPSEPLPLAPQILNKTPKLTILMQLNFLLGECVGGGGLPLSAPLILNLPHPFPPVCLTPSRGSSHRCLSLGPRQEPPKVSRAHPASTPWWFPLPETPPSHPRATELAFQVAGGGHLPGRTSLTPPREIHCLSLCCFMGPHTMLFHFLYQTFTV